MLMFSAAEQDLAKRDWEEAQNAGIGHINEITWLSVEETKNV